MFTIITAQLHSFNEVRLVFLKESKNLVQMYIDLWSLFDACCIRLFARI